MARAAARRASAALVLLLGALAMAPSAPAAAADAELGWVRLQPATGKTDAPVIALTEAACPSDALAAVVKMTGPGIKDGVGNLVGVTQIKAFDETVSGQLWIPLQFVFDQWFLVNSVTPKANAPYTITVTCRDLVRPSLTFGSFVGQVAFDGKGGYKALGDTAKPFDTELKPLDPLVGGGAAPGPAATDGASGAPSEGATTDQGGAGTGGTPGAAGGTPGATGTDNEQPADGATSAANTSRVAAPADNTARNVILGVSVLLLAGIGVTALLGRLRGRSSSADDAGREPTGRREAERVDVL